MEEKNGNDDIINARSITTVMYHLFFPLAQLIDWRQPDEPKVPRTGPTRAGSRCPKKNYAVDSGEKYELDTCIN